MIQTVMTNDFNVYICLLSGTRMMNSVNSLVVKQYYPTNVGLDLYPLTLQTLTGNFKMNEQ